MDAFPLTLIASVPTCISPHRYVLSPHMDAHPFMIFTPSHLTCTDTFPLAQTHTHLHGHMDAHSHGHMDAHPLIITPSACTSCMGAPHLTHTDTCPPTQTHAHPHRHMPTHTDTCPLP